jgi:hypothetical protein
MKTTLTTILIFIICMTQTFGQNSSYHFAKGVFKKDYRKQNFERFSGKVVQINQNTFGYGDKVLIVDTGDCRLLTIFSEGIFHPDVIDKNPATKPLTKVLLDTLTKSEHLFYNLVRNDSTTIGNLKELEKLNPNSKTKRFVFWLYRKGILNPTECYFELFYDKGTKNMTIGDFIKNSRLTFYHMGTIII